MAIIISAFPGKGKSFITKNESSLKVIDSDSSKFHWIWKDGEKTDEENPNFISDYINHIKSAASSGEYDAIFVSSHEDIRNALDKEKIDYFLLYGSHSDKDDYIQLYKDRGNSEKFIDNISSNYDKYVESMDKETFPTKIKMHANEFITVDLIKYMKEYDKNKYENINYALKDINNPNINWAMVSQNTKSFTLDQLKRVSNKIDWDLVSMYSKLPKEAYDRYPVNVDYLLKYRKRYLTNADQKKLKASKKYK